MKRAVIDQIFIGFIIVVALIAFVATSLDETVARDKVYNLKALLNNSVKSMGLYYMNVAEDTNVAEQISDDMFEVTTLGREIKPMVVYTWDLVEDVGDPYKHVTTTLNNYQHPNLFYSYFGFKFFNMNLSATANIDNGWVSNFVPIAVNGCTQTFNEGDTYEYLLKSYDLYDPTDNVGFFGVYPEGGGQSSFAHLKNVVNDVMADNITADTTVDLDFDMSVATVDSSQIANDVKQIAQAFAISTFTSKPMSIVEVGCGSTADNLEETRIFEINMTGVFCGDGCIGSLTDCSLLDMTGNVFNATAWDTAVSSCNSEEFFKIEFTINKIRSKSVTIQGE